METLKNTAPEQSNYNTEKDSSRAHEMALKGDKYETEAAESRRRGKKLLELAEELCKAGDPSAKSVRQAAQGFQKNAENAQYTANVVEEIAGSDYDERHKSAPAKARENQLAS